MTFFGRILNAGAACCCALALLASPRPARAQADADPSRLTFPPLRPIRPLHPARYVMPNGLVVFLLENHELPVVTGSAYFRTSAAWLPADKVGLGGLTGEVMRSGGSARHPGDWLDDRLGAIGASISTGITVDDAQAGFRCLSENCDEVMGLLADVLRNPAFPQDKIELSRVALRRSIAERNDEMFPVLVRVARQAVYGKDSPYARLPEYRTVNAIQREDCVRLHGLIFAPNRMILSVYGDFQSAAMKKRLEQLFGSWPRSAAPVPQQPQQPPLTPRRAVFASKPDVTQTGMLLVHTGFKATEPDYPAMDVYEMWLGGGFQSRLFNRIRTQRGLAYAAGATAGSGFQRAGMFVAYSLTRAESTLTALDILREEVENSTRVPAPESEVRIARESVLNNFVFKFEQPEQVLDRAVFYEFAGYPEDFLQRYQKAVEAVTPESMLQAARRHVHPASLITVIAGKESDFERPLSTLDEPLERVDISIPPP